jgi:hypothetical protein
MFDLKNRTEKLGFRMVAKTWSLRIYRIELFQNQLEILFRCQDHMVLKLTFGLLDYDQRVGQNSASGLPQSEARLENPNFYLPPDLKR